MATAGARAVWDGRLPRPRPSRVSAGCDGKFRFPRDGTAPSAEVVCGRGADMGLFWGAYWLMVVDMLWLYAARVTCIRSPVDAEVALDG